MLRSFTNRTFIVGAALTAMVALVLGFKYFSGDTKEGSKMKLVSPQAFKSYQSLEGVIDIHHWQNKLGTNVYFVNAPELPIVDVRVIFDAGSARNQKAVPLAYFANFLLNHGTDVHNADEIAAEFEMLGAQYSAGAYRDMAFVSVRSLSDAQYLDKAIDLYAQVISKPKYDEISLNREKQNAISMLKFQAQTPQSIGERAFFEALYPENSYSYWELGDEKNIKKIQPKDLSHFHQSFYVKNNATVVIVGDVSLEKANAISEQVLAGLADGQKAPALAPVKAPKQIDKKIKFSSTQTHIMYGMPVLKRQDPDYYALVVGNHILGGNSQNNRVFDTIRGKYGLAYSAYSYFQPMAEAGPFMMVCQTRAEEAMRAKALLESLLKEYIEKGPTDDELVQAKQNLLGGYPLLFDSNSNIASQLSILGFYNLPLDYFNQYQNNVDKVTTAAIKDAFARRLDMKKMVTVMVGESK